MFLRRRTIKDVATINKILKAATPRFIKVVIIGVGREYRSLRAYELANEKICYSTHTLIEIKQTTIEITTKRYEYGQTTTYVFSLNCDDKEFAVRGNRAFAELQKVLHMKRCDYLDNNYIDHETGKFIPSAKPLLGYSEEYEGKRLCNVYEYDMNSAYTAAMYDRIPDINNPIKGGVVGKNQVGFILDNDCTMVASGLKCHFRFNLIETPANLKDWLIDHFLLKQKGIDKAEQKALLNLPIGYCQRYNPFFRAYVVQTCNNVIKNLIDENTIMWNTDAIYSLKKRDDIPLGNGLGQFKLTIAHTFAYVGHCYQINNEIPKYRGVPKENFKEFERIHGRPFDILKDNISMINNHNLYKLDESNMKIVYNN